MSVFKIEKNKNYTIMSNYHLRDKNLSLRAKGLLSFMLSLPDDWAYSINGLVSVNKEGLDAIKSILNELKRNNYLKIIKYKNERGLFEYEYLIYEQPLINPEWENPPMDYPALEKPTQINTNKQIDKDDKTISSFFITEEHNILTLELIDRGYINEKDTQIFYYDKLFEDLLEQNNTYKDLICIIHYIIPRVIERNFNDENGNLITNKYGYLKNALNSNIYKLNNKVDLWN